MAFLALRPLRRRNLAALRLGEHVRIEQDRVRITIDSSEMKGRFRGYEFDWPNALRDEFRCYIDHIRPLLISCRPRNPMPRQPVMHCGSQRMAPPSVQTPFTGRFGHLRLRHSVSQSTFTGFATSRRALWQSTGLIRSIWHKMSSDITTRVQRSSISKRTSSRLSGGRTEPKITCWPTILPKMIIGPERRICTIDASTTCSMISNALSPVGRQHQQMRYQTAKCRVQNNFL